MKATRPVDEPELAEAIEDIIAEARRNKISDKQIASQLRAYEDAIGRDGLRNIGPDNDDDDNGRCGNEL